MTTINQLQLTYNPEEDRILLRVNTSANEEFRFWLTRRFSIHLGNVLQAHRAIDPDISTQRGEIAKRAVQSYKREEAISKGNFDEKFKAAENLPLGDAPVMAFRLTYRMDAEKMHLSIEPKSGRGITITVDSQINFNICKLLRTASGNGNWGLSLDQEAPPIPEDRVIN